jgi:release factor glutamine methyltransferase
MLSGAERAQIERHVARRLAAGGVASPAWDARRLVEYAASTGAELEPLVAARVRRVPLQHLTGRAGFRHLDLAVGPGVFVPRPETELVAGAVLDAIGGVDHPVVVDLCAGTGAIGLSVAWERAADGRDCEVHLVETDPAALVWLDRNRDEVLTAIAAGPISADRMAARRPRVQCTVHHADLAAAPVDVADVVVANPPYLSDGAPLDAETAEHDPPVALWGGPDGLAVIHRVVGTARRLLRPGGRLVVEHDTTHDLTALLTPPAWREVRRHDDLTGRPRFTTAVAA